MGSQDQTQAVRLIQQVLLPAEASRPPTIWFLGEQRATPEETALESPSGLPETLLKGENSFCRGFGDESIQEPFGERETVEETGLTRINQTETSTLGHRPSQQRL